MATIYNAGAAVEVRVMAYPGVPGEGVPEGGTTGQVPVKSSDTSYDIEWVTIDYTMIGGLAAVLAGKANAVSPILVGTPEAETPDPGDDSARIATTEWVNDEIAGKLDKAGDTMTGPLGIGHDPDIVLASLTAPRLAAHANVAGEAGIGAVRWTNDTGGANIIAGKSRSAMIGTPGAVQSGDTLGAFAFVGDDGTAFTKTTASLRAVATEAFDGTHRGARFEFWTIPTGGGDLNQQRLAVMDYSTGLAMYGPTNIVINQNRHFRFRQYSAGSLPTPAAGDAIASADITAAMLVCDGVEWLSPGVRRMYTVTANGTVSIPAGWAVDQIHIANTTANAVTGGIKIGTTSGATDVVTAQAVGANALLTIASADILKKVFSRTAAQTLFVQAVTAWNSASLEISFSLRKVF